jgi:hypothetical protein
VRGKGRGERGEDILSSFERRAKLDSYGIKRLALT